VNALRSVLYEHGYSFPTGIAQLKQIRALLDGPDNSLFTLVQEECQDLIEQIADKTVRIAAKTIRIKTLSTKTDNPDYDKNMVFVKVNWDFYSISKVAKKYNIPRRSTLLMLRGNEELGRIVAGTSKNQIRQLMDLGLSNV